MQTVSDGSEEPLEGERLDRAQIGPGRVENLDHVLERGRVIAPESAARPRRGAWVVPKRGGASAARSGRRYLTNEWGDPRMELEFPARVELEGVWISGQSHESVWPRAVRVVGYRGEARVAATAWFGPLSEAPAWFEIGLRGVDRVEFEASPAWNGAAWYALDDLSWWRAEERVVLDFEDLPPGARLSGEGAHHAGLEWGLGTGFVRPPAPSLTPPTEALPEPAVEAQPDEQETPAVPPAGDGLGVARPDSGLPDGGYLGGGGTAPVAIYDFAGPDLVLSNNSIPPDTHGAIGLEHFCAFVNRVFAVYDRTNGVRLFSTGLQQFLPGATGDPRVLFDQSSGRWFAVATGFGGSIQLAVSLTSDPLGAWFKTQFVAAGGADTGCTVDYPTLGVDVNGLYIAAHMIGPCGLTLFAIDKAPLLDATPALGTITAFRNLATSSEGAIQPAHTHGTAQGEYFLSLTTSNAIRVRRVDPPLTAPTLASVGAPSVGTVLTPLNVPALGSSVPLKTFDARFLNAVVRDDHIWTTHHVRVDGRAAVRWYEIDGGTGAIVQSGTVADPVRHYFYPSIAVNAERDVVLGFSGSSASQYAGAYFTGRLSSDAPGQTAPPVLLRPGAGPYTVLDPFGFNRWGDYSHSTLDPVGETRLWTIQEYTDSANRWGTWIGELEFGGTVVCPDPVAYCIGAANSVGAGARMGSAGSTSATLEDLVVLCRGCPPGQPGTFYYGPAAIQLPFGDGLRCVGGGTFRFPATTTDFFGDASHAVDFGQPPAGSGPGALVLGSRWYFQFWYRDPAAGGAGFNLSDGLELTVCP